jgi:hypothetical protein
MKKAMIGILILIPVIILLIVAAVSSIVSTTAYIAVESIDITAKAGGNSVSLSLSNTIFDIYDYAAVSVKPDHATDKTVEWTIEEIVTKDTEYLTRYNNYVAHKDDPGYDGETVYPAVIMVGTDGAYASSNTTGRFRINTYCEFYIKGTAETFSARLQISILGEDATSVVISGKEALNVGQTALLNAVCNPIDSIVTDLQWSLKSGEGIVSVDANGAVTALSAGTAVVSAKVKQYTSDNYIESSDFTVTVHESVSDFGSVLYTDKETITASEIGLGEIVSHNDKCTVAGRIISGIQNGAEVTTTAGTLTIYRCDKDDIVIENASLYGFDASAEESFVLAVGEVPLKLSARWKSQTRAGKPEVDWSSAYTNVAGVSADGTVTGAASGLAKIAAVLKSDSSRRAEINVNVQQKIVMLLLKTTDKTLSVGIAGETVFASKRFTEDVFGLGLEANSFAFEFDYPNAPTGADEAETAAFYNAFNYEIVAGADGIAHTDIAYFDGNVLIFKPDKITSSEKVALRVKISAKYPKYRSLAEYTTSYVDINVVNGVVCYTYDQLKMVGEGVFTGEQIDGLQEQAFNYNNANPDNKISVPAAVLGANIQYPDGGAGSMNNDRNLHFFGNIYGNNFMLSANMSELNGGTPLIRIMCSDVTLSNIIARGNRVAPGQEEISSVDDMLNDDGTGFVLTGYVIDIQPYDWEKTHTQNVRIEYSTIENGGTVMGLYNTEVTIDGCIMRNSPGAGLYIPNQIKREEVKENDVVVDILYYLAYTHLNLNNCVMSNILGTGFNFFYQSYITVKDENGEADKVWRRYYDAGIRSRLRQTGFLDIYNWQRTDNAQFIRSGNEKIDNAIKGPMVEVVSTSEVFDKFRMNGQEGIYVHLGFMTSGISLNGERSTLRDDPDDIYIEDKRFGYVDTTDLKYSFLEISSFADARVWCYRNDLTNITPSSVYRVNEKLINRLRGV